VSITAELDKAEAQRDQLISGLRRLFYNTVAGNGLSSSMHTTNGKVTDETIEQALAALETYIKNEKAHRDEESKLHRELDELRAEKRIIQKYFGVGA
jgi:uncharacterized coiled-coil DUF342 family protein